MHRCIRRSVAALAGALALLGAFAGEAQAAPAMWAVKDKDSTIYLFGTIHALPDATDWRTPAYAKAYEASQTVWFEMNLKTPPMLLASAMFANGLDRDHRLSERLTKDEFATVVERLGKLGYPESAVEHFRPWLAGTMLMALQFKDGGLDVKQGVDMQVTGEVVAQEKPTRYFETAAEQFAIFSNLSPEAEMQFFHDCLDMNLSDGAFGKSITAAWMGGSDKALDEGFVDDMRKTRPEFYASAVKRRNLAWADTLTEEMRGSGVELVNVGAAHLVGEDGLPALLRARGFTVVRIQ